MPLEVCISAAVRADDGTVFLCERHHEGMAAAADAGAGRIRSRNQGFMTSRGRFVDRREGLRLQLAAGIASAAEGGYRGTQLYSEDLG